MSKLILILSDIHHKVERVEHIIKSVNADQVILLGDYFDDFNDTPEQVINTCKWLNNSVKHDNRIHLFGNHDIHYLYNYRTFRCSGYEQWKSFIVQDCLDKIVLNKFKWVHILDDKWLLSHAGLDNSHLPEDIAKLAISNRPLFVKTVESFLSDEIRNGIHAAANGSGSWVLEAGRSRGGGQRIGGIIWCDFNSEFTPIRGLNQIFGHSPQRGNPSWIICNNIESIPYKINNLIRVNSNDFNDINKSYNLCLDVWQNMHYAIYNGYELSIHSINNI